MNVTNVLIGLGLIVLAGVAVWAWAVVSSRRVGKKGKAASAKPRSGGGVGEER